MNRFEKTSRSTDRLRLLFALLLFFVLILLFLWGLSVISKNTSSQEKKSLEDSIRKSAVHCYALEGFYPEDLAYLEENYGLTYDHKKYVVSYEIVGENMMPDIMVIRLNTKGGPDL